MLGAVPAFAGWPAFPGGPFSAAAAASNRSSSGECGAATLNRPAASWAKPPGTEPDAEGLDPGVVAGAVSRSGPDRLSAEPSIRVSRSEPRAACPRPGLTIATPVAPEAIRTARVISQNVRRPTDAAPTKAPRAHVTAGIGQKSATAVSGQSR